MGYSNDERGQFCKAIIQAAHDLLPEDVDLIVIVDDDDGSTSLASTLDEARTVGAMSGQIKRIQAGDIAERHIPIRKT